MFVWLYPKENYNALCALSGERGEKTLPALKISKSQKQKNNLKYTTKVSSISMICFSKDLLMNLIMKNKL